MKNYDYGYGFKPISAWGYVGRSILWSIPVIGWLILLCKAIGAKNRNVRNYARSFFCKLLLAIIVAVVCAAVAVVLDLVGVIDAPAILEAAGIDPAIWPL